MEVDPVIPVEWRGGGFVDGDQARVKYTAGTHRSTLTNFLTPFCALPLPMSPGIQIPEHLCWHAIVAAEERRAQIMWEKQGMQKFVCCRNTPTPVFTIAFSSPPEKKYFVFKVGEMKKAGPVSPCPLAQKPW
ncbi:uncharacterized protein LOC144872777 isoform X1 [Branchiostoma floridae x Branchiostoma japonicum]